MKRAYTPEQLAVIRSWVEQREDGVFVWRRAPAQKIKVGQPAGTVMKSGFVLLALRGENHYAHRLSWALAEGGMAEGVEVCHIGDRSDNRRENLRLGRAPRKLSDRPRSDAGDGHVYPGVRHIGGALPWQVRHERGDGTTVIRRAATKEEAVAMKQHLRAGGDPPEKLTKRGGKRSAG